MMAGMVEVLEDVARRLYALPFDEFVPARTVAAKDAAASDRPLSQAIRELPKPSVAAWAVNMLAHHRPEAVQQLSDLGQTMQDAQASLDAAALRELARERRKLLGEAVAAARLAAEEHGRKISGPVATEVEDTLRAATADPAAAAAVQSGMLLRVLSADGVDQVDLGGAVAVPAALGTRPARPRTARTTAGQASTAGRPAPPHASRQSGAPEKPRLQAVREAPRPPSPSVLDKALAVLAEAETAAAEAVGEAELRVEAQEEASAAFDRLTAAVTEARKRLQTLEASLEAARKERDVAAAEAKQAARAAEKSQRSAMLAKERVLRLRNTPD
jgi:hypothetical protein